MTVSVFGDGAGHGESSSTTKQLFNEVLHEIPSLSPKYSILVDVTELSPHRRRRAGLSWTTAMGIVMFVLVVSAIAVFMLYPKESITAALEHASSWSLKKDRDDEKALARTKQPFTSSSPWDATTVASSSSASTKSTSSTASSTMSMYLGHADVDMLSRSAAPLTEQQRLVDWLVPIVGGYGGRNNPRGTAALDGLDHASAFGIHDIEDDDNVEYDEILTSSMLS
jgi:hypothetical protein